MIKMLLVAGAGVTALQLTATHYNTPQHTAPLCTTPHHTAPHRTTMQRTATRRILFRYDQNAAGRGGGHRRCQRRRNDSACHCADAI